MHGDWYLYKIFIPPHGWNGGNYDKKNYKD